MSVRWFRTVVSVVLVSMLTVGGLGAAASADTNPTLPLLVNFQAQTTTTPSGYVGDYGQAYDATRGYGWVNASTGAALSFVGNGRERGVASDKRLDTFIHMQLPAGSPGVTTPGAWKAAVPNGSYQVTVAVGDPSYTDSHHVIRVEGQTAVDFTPTGAQTSQTNTITVNVTDGFVNVDATGGTNTKIDYLQIQPTGTTAPHVTSVVPANGATNVFLDSAVTVQLSNGVNPNTANASGLQLFTSGNQQVAGHYNTDGAYSNATFVSSVNLSPNSVYTVKVTSALQDPQGNAYQPFTSTFTTGTSVSQQQSPVSFTQTTLDSGDGTNGTSNTAGPTALAIGPDGKLYAAFGTGDILAYSLDANGNKVGAPTEITAFKFNRTIAGLKFDPASTASNLTLWVSNGQFGCDLAALGVACNDFTGMVSKLTGTSASSLVRTDVITGLPRSVGNHMNNGVDFGPDGALYLAQAANNGFGAPDDIWGNRAEDPLTAAVLRIDVKNITTFPYSVDTSKGYSPTAAGAKVTLYATGTRNPFSVLWDSNGKLYAPVNESSNGNTPADPNGGAPALTDLPAFDDYFTQVVQGKYYGHPNPTRNEYRLNGANPTSGTDAFEVPQYPVGTQPNSNWRKPDMDLGLHRSADGSVEFKSNVFGGNLKGQVLLTEYSNGKDIIAVQLDSNGNAVSKTVVASGFNNPLPITSDPVSGRVYVGEYGRDPDGAGGQIDLLTPNVTTGGGGTGTHVNFQAQTTTTPTGYSPDYGQPYDSTRGYGWVDGTGNALSLVGNGRERGVASDKRLDTFIHMQLPAGSGGVTTPGTWQATEPNGTYTVTVGVGDPSYSDSHDVINVNGVKAIDFTPSASNNTTATITSTVTNGKLVLDANGGTNTKVDYVDIVPTGSTPPDTTAPTATVTTSGTTDASGNYQGSATVTIAAADNQGGSGVASVKYSLDNGAAQTYANPFAVSTVGSHTVVATVKDNAGNTGTASKTFTVVAGSTNSTLQVTSPDSALSLGNRLVFSTVAGDQRGSQALSLKNTGTTALNVTGLAFSGSQGSSFQLASGQASTFSIPANGTVPVNVVFRPVDATVVNTGVLTITTNSSGSPTTTVTLGGLNALDYEGDNEPSMQDIFNALGYTTNAGVTGFQDRNSISNSRLPAGDEVVSAYWKRANSAQPVQLIPVAHYSGRSTDTSGPVTWFTEGSGNQNNLFSIPGGSDISGGQNQRLLPTLTSGSTTSFSTSSAFGLADEDGDYSDDMLGSSRLHNFRFYPAKAADGSVIANTWLVGDDIGQDANPDSGKNWDFQDYVFLLKNANPENAAAPVPGNSALNLDFSSAKTGTIADKTGKGTGFTSVQANTAGNQYQAGQLTLDTTNGALKVLSTAGSNTDNDNTQQNALQMAFDGTRQKFRVQARLLGPFTNLNSGVDQQTIFVGPDQDNYFKVEVEYADPNVVLTVWFEQNGTGNIVSRTTLSNPSASTVDLFIDGDASTGSFQGRYRVNSSNDADIQALGSATQVDDVMRWFNRQSQAAIMTSNAQGGSPFTATYDSFKVIGQ